MEKKEYKQLGTYGLIIEKGKILLIKKNGEIGRASCRERV